MNIAYVTECRNDCGTLRSPADHADPDKAVPPRRVRCSVCRATHYLTGQDIEYVGRPEATDG